jgi:hypothetical protein
MIWMENADCYLRRRHAVTRLRGHFDGRHIVLDEPPPAELTVNTPVEIVISKSREEVLRELEASLREWWEQPLPPGFQPQGRQWTREGTYERGRKPPP